MDAARESMGDDKKKSVGKKYLVYIITAAAIWFSFKYLLPLILPLVLAALVVIPSASVIHKINHKLHIGKGILTGGLLILIVFLLLLLIWMVIVWLLGNISVIFQNGNTIWGQLTDIVCDGCEIIEEHTGMQRGAVTSLVKERGTVMIADLQNTLIPKVMMSSVKSVRWIVNVIVTLLITSLAAVLLAKDYEAIKQALYKTRELSVVINIFHKIGSMLVGYVKAQGIIYLTIAGICLLGYFLLRLQHPFQTAMITAFLDVLPFIGTGIILGPMVVWYLLNAEYWKALICAGIYLLCVVTRQLLEPRLIGRNTGIFPIIILISIYTGVKLYGLGGVILGPLSFLLYKEIVATYQRYNK
ncbi:MAG: AI-2E family transporter [Lachnospiraceae bacterium]|nr:AI-2E family transporter [Lachnospiraceae bacterium]